MISIAAAIPDVLYPGTWYAAIKMANDYFSILIIKDHTLSAARVAIQLHCLFQDYFSSPALCHNLVCRDLVHLSIPRASH